MSDYNGDFDDFDKKQDEAVRRYQASAKEIYALEDRARRELPKIFKVMFFGDYEFTSGKELCQLIVAPKTASIADVDRIFRHKARSFGIRVSRVTSITYAGDVFVDLTTNIPDSLPENWENDGET